MTSQNNARLIEWLDLEADGHQRLLAVDAVAALDLRELVAGIIGDDFVAGICYA